MELHEANRILRSVKSALAADGAKLPPSADTDGLMMLLGRLDCDKYLAPKIKHARTAAPASAAYKRLDAQIRFFRALQAAEKGIQSTVSTVSFMLLHKSVCGDLDINAGKPRQNEYIENGSAHTAPMYISGSIKSILTKMNGIESSPAISKEDFAGYLTHYMRELIILHPFETGSDFTVRLFIMLFCRLKGFALGYYRTSPAALKAAESAAFTADDVTPLYKIFADCLSYERTVEKKSASPKTRRELKRDLAAAPPAGISAYEDRTEADGGEQVKPQQQNRRDLKQKPTRADKTGKSEKQEHKEKADVGRKPPVGENANNDAQKREPFTQAQYGHERQKRRNDVERPASQRDGAKKPTDDDVLKRAIKLQQKISKLNDQLTELMLTEKNNKK